MDNLAQELFGSGVAMARRLARTVGPQTSKEAAEKMVESGELNRQERWVLRQIENSMYQILRLWK